ncbi:transcriptional repressor LexA [candidate division KSB1 bacterium]|nr:transcriptional repressor LexA [candidate division KSB1 bacterium]
MKNITETQHKVLQGIESYVNERGYPPTIREIMDMFGYASVNNVQRILSVLENKGYIKRDLRGGARCIELVREKNNSSGIKKIPMLGQIAAGEPIFAEQNIEGYYQLDCHLFGSTADFILRVRGNSMTGANIFHNDLIVVRQTSFPQNNDIIVALLDEEATVKRFFLEESTIRLQPENDEYQPIIINKNDMYFKILGKVEAVIHQL